MKGKIAGWPQRYYLNEGGVVGWREVSAAEYHAALPAQSLVGDDGEQGAPVGNQPGAWPMLSDALAVHPDQIEEAMARNKKHGLNVEYNREDGRPILADRGMRRELLRVEKLVDRNGSYGD